jgi:hypothetical protein
MVFFLPWSMVLMDKRYQEFVSLMSSSNTMQQFINSQQSQHPQSQPHPQQQQQSQAIQQAFGDMDMVLWLVAACGWSVAGLLFLVPSCYWFIVHGLSIVGFFAIATGRTKTMWPPFESTVATVQRVARAVQNAYSNSNSTHPDKPNPNNPLQPS